MANTQTSLHRFLELLSHPALATQEYIQHWQLKSVQASRMEHHALHCLKNTLRGGRNGGHTHKAVNVLSSVFTLSTIKFNLQLSSRRSHCQDLFCGGLQQRKCKLPALRDLRQSHVFPVCLINPYGFLMVENSYVAQCWYIAH